MRYSLTLLIAALVLMIFISGTLAQVDEHRPRTFSDFFAEASIELLAAKLPPGESLGWKSRDVTDWDTHYNWAKFNDMPLVKSDLIDKFNRMVEIMARQEREKLANWYADVAVEWAEYGIDLGSETANSTDREVHKRWAMREDVGPEDIRLAIVDRIERIAAWYLQEILKDVPPERTYLARSYALSSEIQKKFSDIEQAMTIDLARSQQDAMAEGLKIFRQHVDLGMAQVKAPIDQPQAIIEGIQVYPYHGDGYMPSLAYLLVEGNNFGTEPGSAELVLDEPLAGQKRLAMLPYHADDWKRSWTEDTLALRVPLLRGLAGPRRAVLRITPARGIDRPAELPVTLIPRMTIRQISGRALFEPQFRNEDSGFIELNNAFLFVYHDPACPEGSPGGNDLFLRDLPASFTVKKVQLTQIDPFEEDSWDQALDASRRAIELVEQGFHNLLLLDVADGTLEHVGQVGTSDSGGYLVRVIKEPDADSPLMVLHWENTCEGTYAGKRLMYIVTFFILAPEDAILPEPEE
jgi:hypothetical protein